MSTSLPLRIVIAWLLQIGVAAQAFAQQAPPEKTAVAIYLDPCERALDTRALEAQLRIELAPRKVSFVAQPIHEVFGFVVDESAPAPRGTPKTVASTEASERAADANSTHALPNSGDDNVTDTKQRPATLVNVHFSRCEPDAPALLVWTSVLNGAVRPIPMVDSPREDRPRNLALVVHELVREAEASAAFVLEQDSAISEKVAPREEAPAKGKEEERKEEKMLPPKAPPLKRSDAPEIAGTARFLLSGDFFFAGPLLSYSITRLRPFELSVGASMLKGSREEELGSVRATLLSAFAAPRYHLRLPYGLGFEGSAVVTLGGVFASSTASSSTGEPESVRSVIADLSARAAFTAVLGPQIEVGLFAGIGSMLRGLDILVRGEKTSAIDGGFFDVGLVMRVPLTTSAEP